MTRYTATFCVESENGKHQLSLTGRDAWALSELIKAGSKGCTPIDNPGPRWSGYVHVLRHDHGLSIETVYEQHRGAFPGNHARYILRSPVRLVAAESEAA